MKRSILLGVIGFTAASLIVFSTVAFGERWMYRNLGILGSYATWAGLFALLGGVLLSPLVDGDAKIRRFLPIFAIGFFLYSVAWVFAYFFLGIFGALVGSLAGSILLALVIAIGFGAVNAFAILAAILFVANSAGKFIGAMLFYFWVPGSAGMVLWGLIYGIGLGAGIGLAVYLAQGGKVSNT